MARLSREHNFRKGDSVMVIAGGSDEKRPLKGKVGKILRIVGKNSERLVLDGLNMMTKHQRARGPNQKGGKVIINASVHCSNVMYYAEKLKKPVKLKRMTLKDGKRVRGYIDTSSKDGGAKEFVQIAEK